MIMDSQTYLLLSDCRSAGLTRYFVGGYVRKVCERDVRRGSYRSRARRRSMSEVPAASAAMSRIRIMTLTALCAFSASFEQYAALFATIRRRRCKTSCHRCQAPLLDVGFDEDEA
jgi:hypothetical protein